MNGCHNIHGTWTIWNHSYTAHKIDHPNKIRIDLPCDVVLWLACLTKEQWIWGCTSDFFQADEPWVDSLTLGGIWFWGASIICIMTLGIPVLDVCIYKVCTQHVIHVVMKHGVVCKAHPWAPVQYYWLSIVNQMQLFWCHENKLLTNKLGFQHFGVCMGYEVPRSGVPRSDSAAPGTSPDLEKVQATGSKIALFGVHNLECLIWKILDLETQVRQIFARTGGFHPLCIHPFSCNHYILLRLPWSAAFVLDSESQIAVKNASNFSPGEEWALK